jgi:MoxR-like ATPase
MIEMTPANSFDRTRFETDRIQRVLNEVSRIIVGQEDVLTQICIALLCNGHILLEGVPGVAKTTMIKALTNALGLSFKRIQFTPDLLPADLIGSPIYNPKTHEFETKKGPLFANMILADEINRAPAKVQAALLEAMQERQVTIGSQTFPLDKPFLVFATQNPVEQEGPYRLPEAQLDRFLLKIHVEYPNRSQEKQLLTRSLDTAVIQPILSKEDILALQELATQVYVDERILDYIVNIVFATRDPKAYRLDKLAPYIHYGASPRASLALLHAAKAFALIRKRHFVTPDDIKAIAYAVLRHRIVRTYEAEADGVTSDQIVQIILSTIATP